MTGHCDQYPVRIVMARNRIQFRYDVREVTEEDKVFYEFQYVEADEATRDSILAALTSAGVQNAQAVLDEVGEIIVSQEPDIR